MYKIKLSPYAETLYNEWLLYPSNSRYNMVAGQKLHGNLDILRLKVAINRYIKDHLILNSHIHKSDEKLYWIRNSSIEDLNYSDNDDMNESIDEFVDKCFNLNEGPLYRFKLFKIATDTYEFIVVFHHIVVDGASVDEGLFKTLAEYYNNENYSINLSIDKQKELVSNLTDILYSKIERAKSSSKLFWDKQLLNTTAINLNFLKLNNRAVINTNQTRQIKFDFYDNEIKKLNQLKRKFVITPYLYSQCILAMLLFRYTGQENFAICYPVSIKEGTNFLYGSQVNTSVVVYKFNENMTVLDLLEQARNFFKTLKDNQTEVNYSYYPTHNLVENVGKGLLNVFFNQANFTQKTFEFIGINCVEILDIVDSSLIDFLLFRQEIRNNVLSFRINYSKNYFDEELLENFVNIYKKLFVEMLNDLSTAKYDKLISSYDLLNPQQYKQIVYNFNNTQKKYKSMDLTIHQLFEDAVKKTPNQIALIYEDVKLTYLELNQKSNQLARYLQETYSVLPTDTVALFLDRSEHMLITIIAILKSGAAYVPIIPDYPVVRTGYILADSHVKLILTNEIYLSKLKEITSSDTVSKQQILTSTIIAIDTVEIRCKLSYISNKNLDIEIKNDNLAYIMYTSGTTGDPKGVMVEHRNVINTILSLDTVYDFQYGNRVLAFASYMFDVSVSNFFYTLFNNGELYIISEDTLKDEKSISKYIIKNRINYAYLPPSLLAIFPRVNYPDLIGIIYAGEPCDKKTGTYWSSKFKLYNYYGPTETAIYASGKQVINGDVELIGKPLPNTKFYILDKNLSVLPIGAIGELFIGGAGVSRGYLNNEILTNKKFIINPIQDLVDGNTDQPVSRLYKTGDLARLLPDGNYEYIGRNDNQIKLRGFRIELDEIQSQLSKYNGIEQSLVLIREHVGVDSVKHKYIIAYCTASQKLDENDILGFLNNLLPKYMLPNAIVFLDKLPISSSSGKVNCSALPDPIFTSEEIYVAPTNELQLRICNYFAKVLSLPENMIGINHDFFKLGGNSILAINLLNHLSIDFEISIENIFNLKTPAKIAQIILNKKTKLDEKIQQIENIYQKIIYFEDVDIANYTDDMYKKQLKYVDETAKIVLNKNVKKLQNILVTGCTGHLGCHILNKLLVETDYTLYVLIRANSDEDAYLRLDKKYKYYFDNDLTNYKNRIVAMRADIQYQNLKLDTNKYQILVNNIDSIIHCAALVKHYGEYEEFYTANVQPTINLLELAKLCRNKDFHYISTVSAVMDCYIADQKYYIFNEDDDISLLPRYGNVYAQTKYEAERIVYSYRKDGVNTNIYRIGNLVMNSTTHKFQENIEDNMFYSHLRVALRSGIIPTEITKIEISPVDYTALAIVKLFNQEYTTNQIYHVFNPNICNLLEIVDASENISLKECSLSSFINYVMDKLNLADSQKNIELLLLYRFWQNNVSNKELTQIKIVEDKTNKILDQLGFNWPKITNNMLANYINKASQ